MSVTFKILEQIKVGQGHKASLKRMPRPITIKGLTPSAITAAEKSLKSNILNMDVHFCQSHWSIKSRSR